MAAHLMRSLAVSILHPALHLSPCPAASRGLCTSLLRPFRSGLRSLLKPGLGVLVPLPTSLTPALQPALGFKTKGVIKKRCKDCYLVKRRGRWYIYCKTNPRHKQRQM